MTDRHSGSDYDSPTSAFASALVGARNGDDPVAILIVDDNHANLIALRALLEPLGAEVVMATSGEEALRSVLQRDFANL